MGPLFIYFFTKKIHLGSRQKKEVLIKEQITDEKNR
jgi:YQGE family putative transporter